MEITESMIYWITRCDDIKGVLAVSAAALITGSIVVIIFCIILVYDEEDSPSIRSIKRTRKRALPFMIIGILLGISSVFVPTTKEMCAIKVIPAIAQNEDIQQLPVDFTKLAREWMEKMKPEKSTEK